MPQYGFYFDSERCVGCRACEIACQMWNESAETVKWRGVSGIERGVYPEIKSVNVSLACMHCAAAPCIKACPRKALLKAEQTGIVLVNQRRCVGCMLCLWACPFGAPQLGVDGKMEKCHFCEDRPLDMKRACEEVCPTQAIISGPVDELTRNSKRTPAEDLLNGKKTDAVLGHQ